VIKYFNRSFFPF